MFLFAFFVFSNLSWYLLYSRWSRTSQSLFLIFDGIFFLSSFFDVLASVSVQSTVLSLQCSRDILSKSRLQFWALILCHLFRSSGSFRNITFLRGLFQSIIWNRLKFDENFDMILDANFENSLEISDTPITSIRIRWMTSGYPKSSWDSLDLSGIKVLWQFFSGNFLCFFIEDFFMLCKKFNFTC